MGVRLHPNEKGCTDSDSHRTLLELPGISSPGLELELGSPWDPPAGSGRHDLLLLHDTRTTALLLADDSKIEVRQLATHSNPVRLAVSRLFPVHLRHGREK